MARNVGKSHKTTFQVKMEIWNSWEKKRNCYVRKRGFFIDMINKGIQNTEYEKEIAYLKNKNASLEKQIALLKDENRNRKNDSIIKRIDLYLNIMTELQRRCLEFEYDSNVKFKIKEKIHNELFEGDFYIPEYSLKERLITLFGRQEKFE